MSSKKRKSRKRDSNKIDWPDVAYAATTQLINKGQVPVILGLIAVIIFAWRLPEQVLGQVTMDLVTIFKNLYLLGWAMGFAMLIYHVTRTRRLRQSFNIEIKRVTKERDDLQAQISNGKIESSTSIATPKQITNQETQK